jgi:type I site-specific restriction endonuclease
LQKARGKHSCQEAFADENKAEAEILATFAAEKHTQKMVEHAQWMAELEIKKQHIDLEASEKQLQAEDHWLTAQHQWEHEKEAHDLQMFCLHLQYQGANAIGVGQFGAQQFRDAAAFEGVAGEDLLLPHFSGWLYVCSDSIFSSSF